MPLNRQEIEKEMREFTNAFLKEAKARGYTVGIVALRGCDIDNNPDTSTAGVMTSIMINNASDHIMLQTLSLLNKEIMADILKDASFHSPKKHPNEVPQ